MTVSTLVSGPCVTMPPITCVLKRSLQHQPDWRTLIPSIRRYADVEAF